MPQTVEEDEVTQQDKRGDEQEAIATPVTIHLCLQVRPTVSLQMYLSRLGVTSKPQHNSRAV